MHELIAHGLYRPRVPGALHQRAAAGGARRRRARRPVRVRPRRGPGRRPQSAQQAGGTARATSRSRPTSRRAPIRPRGPLHAADGTPVAPAFQLLRERVARLHARVGRGDHRHPARDASALAHEMGVTARDQAFELPIAWTDAWGKRARERHRPVAFHAMRGLAAHSNGFQTVRALAVLMSCSARSTRPAASATRRRTRAHIPPNYRASTRPSRSSRTRRSTRRRSAFRPSRRSWRRRRRHADAHRQGVLVGVPAVGARADAQRDHQRVARRSVPHRHAADLHGQHGVELDHEHAGGARDAERRKDADGEYKIPFLVVCDAFQ